MNFISLCSGIEAASVAFGPLGWKAICFSEIEAYPCALLKQRYPHVPNMGDMTLYKQWPEQYFIDADVIVGVPPCQSFSVAGLRKGLGDERGNITLIYVQLINHADAIRRKHGRPPVVALYENVPGLLSDKTNAFGSLVGALAGEDDALIPPGGKWTDAGCVFGPERTMAWRILDAQYHELAQRRRRVFVIASAREGFDPATVLLEFEGVRRDFAPSREQGQNSAAGTLRSTDGGSDVDHARAGHLINVEAFGGNNTREAIDVATAVRAHGTFHYDFESETFLTGTLQANGKAAGSATQQDAESGLLVIAHTLRGEGFDASEDGTGRGTPLVPVAYAFDSRMRGAEPAVGRPERPPQVMVERTGALDATKPWNVAAPAIAFPSRMSGTQYASTEELSPALGAENQTAVAHPYTLAIRGRGDGHDLEYRQDGTANALLTPNGGRGGIGVGAFAHAMQVRRLTPRECERLQGFQWRCAPDAPGAWEDGAGQFWSPDYTLVIHGQRIKPEKLAADWIKYLARGNPKGLTAEDCAGLAADGPRYKALGNSWAINCVRWIGKRVDDRLKALEA